MKRSWLSAALGSVSLLILSNCATSMSLQDFYKPASQNNGKYYANGYGWTQSQDSNGIYTLSFRVPNSFVSGSLSDLWDRRANEICGNSQYKKTVYKAERALGYDSYNRVTVAGDYIYQGFLECGVGPAKS